MKYVAEKQAASGARKVGPSGRPSATGGDLLEGKLDGIKADEAPAEAAEAAEEASSEEASTDESE